MATEFISRKYGNDGYEIIIKTDNHEHYKASEAFARRLIDHEKPPVTEIYIISNIGCDDETYGNFEFTKEQFEFLNSVFTELNKNSSYPCMPTIYIDPIESKET